DCDRGEFHRLDAFTDVAAQFPELRFDVVARDLLGRGRLFRHFCLLRAKTTKMLATITATPMVAAYGTHDQLPVSAVPVSSCSTRRRPISTNAKPKPSNRAAPMRQPAYLPSPLSGSSVSCLA